MIGLEWGSRRVVYATEPLMNNDTRFQSTVLRSNGRVMAALRQLFRSGGDVCVSFACGTSSQDRQEKQERHDGPGEHRTFGHDPLIQVKCNIRSSMQSLLTSRN
jgi:hypothetical protein